jgi:nitrous oxidase accessory protein
MELSKGLSIFLFSLILFSVLAIPLADSLAAANSRTITVPTDYPSIQAAVNNAVDGDTIYIKSGYYAENPVVNKSVSLIGEERDKTVIDVTAGLKVQSNNVLVTGLTIFDGYQGITVCGNSCRITGNKVTDSQYGIVLISASGNDVSENVLYSIGLSAAIQLCYSNNNTVRYNQISSCTEGIQLREGSSNNTVIDNMVGGCQDVAVRFLGSGVGYKWYGPDGNVVMRNNITDSRVGASIYGANGNIILGNNFVNNTVQFSANEDYYLTFGGNRSVNTINANYWSDYNGMDSNSDGVGDTPYFIDVNNQDNQPLMRPVDVLPPPFQSTRPQVSTTPTQRASAQTQAQSAINYTEWLVVVLAVVTAISGLLFFIRKRFSTSQISG